MDHCLYVIVLRPFGPCRYFYDLQLPITPLVYNKLFFHNFFWAICLYIFFSLLLETKPNLGMCIQTIQQYKHNSGMEMIYKQYILLAEVKVIIQSCKFLVDCY